MAQVEDGTGGCGSDIETSTPEEIVLHSFPDGTV